MHFIHILQLLICKLEKLRKIILYMNLTIKFTTPSETTMLTRKGKNLHTIT